MQSRHDTVKPNTGPAIARDSKSVTDYRDSSHLIVLRDRFHPDRTMRISLCRFYASEDKKMSVKRSARPDRSIHELISSQ